MHAAVRLKRPKPVQVLKLKYFIYKIMLYNTKLNEFEPEHLELMLGLVQEKMDDLNHKYQTLMFMEPSELRADLLVDTDKLLDVFILWKVQIENAILDVKEMNKVVDN